jgi:hypothetical protein
VSQGCPVEKEKALFSSNYKVRKKKAEELATGSKQVEAEQPWQFLLSV